MNYTSIKKKLKETNSYRKAKAYYRVFDLVYQYVKCKSCYYFFAKPLGMQDLSSLTRD